ncbi:hypothetical protein GFS31_38400 [Leptolyngbya sp. BL0902]|nr:hypothetical protein [Leptolyngbya sp. BL0902]QQE67128.1 hypothetical protein GFS31_38400 [Leptolyngbya sp. BL0902]
MLSFIFTYQDILYLATKLGALGVVVLAYWLISRHDHKATHHG